MANKMKTSVFLSALAALTGGIVLSKHLTTSSEKQDSRPLLPSAVFPSIDQIEIEKSGQKVDLKKSGKNEWVVESDKSFAADANKISQFMDTLNSSKIERTVAKKAENPAQFGLGAAATKLALRGGGKNVLLVEVGDTRSGGGQYIKFADNDSVYLVTGLLSFNPLPDDWHYKTLLRIPRKEIQSISWQTTGQSSNVAKYARKSEADKFELTPAKSGLKEEQFNQLISSLENFSFEKKKDRSDKSLIESISKPVGRITVNLFDGRLVQLTSGSPSSKNEALIPLDVSLTTNPATSKSMPDRFAEEATRLSALNKNYFFLFPKSIAGGS